jgi:hypothetical protein
LIACDEQGKSHIARYEAVNAMSLNEFLKEHGKVEEQTHLNQQQERVLAQQAQKIGKVSNLLRKQ